MALLCVTRTHLDLDPVYTIANGISHMQMDASVDGNIASIEGCTEINISCVIYIDFKYVSNLFVF